MIEEQSFRGDLEKVDESVETFDVREFVGDDGVELLVGEAGDDGERQEDDGTEPADHRGSFKMQAGAVPHGACEAEAILQRQAARAEQLADELGLFAAHALYDDEARGGAEAEQKYADQPGLHEPGEIVRRCGKRVAGRRCRLRDCNYKSICVCGADGNIL